MSLKNIKMKGQSYNHPFTDLAQPLDDKVKAVEEGRWDDLIESHMRLGCAIAGRYVRIGGNSDEMVSAAMLGICTAVDKIKKHGLDHENITGYIVYYIHQHCSEVLRKDTVVPMPRGQRAKTTFSLRDNISSTAIIQRRNMISEEDNTVKEPSRALTHFLSLTKKDDFDIVEFEDTLEQIIKTGLERKIIQYRRLGWTDSAIAKELEVSQSSVTRIRHALLKRYQKI